MKRIDNTDIRLTGEGGPSPDALSVALSVADTLEEDAERYQDVISNLTKFEETEGEIETA